MTWIRPDELSTVQAAALTEEQQLNDVAKSLIG
jgi:hypothetical protein